MSFARWARSHSGTIALDPDGYFGRVPQYSPVLLYHRSIGRMLMAAEGYQDNCEIEAAIIAIRIEEAFRG